MGRRGQRPGGYVTVVSVHSHERGRTPLDLRRSSSSTSRTLSSMLGPMSSPGMARIVCEQLTYHGRPIFFSLGNFVAQFELQTIISSHTYEVFGASPELTAHQIIGGDLLGFATHPEYARAAVPVLRFAGGALKALELYPTTLSQRLPAAQRGLLGHQRRGRAHPERHGRAVRQVRNIRDQQRRHGPHHRAVDPLGGSREAHHGQPRDR